VNGCVRVCVRRREHTGVQAKREIGCSDSCEFRTSAGHELSVSSQRRGEFKLEYEESHSGGEVVLDFVTLTLYMSSDHFVCSVF